MFSILIIDDDEIQLRLERLILQQEGYRVFSTADGPRGIELYRKNRVDLVLLDLGLPSMSGIEVLKEIRRIDPKAKVILITGYPSVESTVLAMQYGAIDYLEKPLDVESMLKKITAVLHPISS